MTQPVIIPTVTRIPRAHRRLMHWWNQLVHVPDGKGGFVLRYRFGFPLKAGDHPVIRYPIASINPDWRMKWRIRLHRLWMWIKSFFKRK